MVFLLDTNAVSDWMKGTPSIRIWATSLDRGDQLITCTIVRGEVLFGIGRMAPGKRQGDLRNRAALFFESVPCESLPEGVADAYAALRVGQQRLGRNLDDNDLWIAATALSLGATLVTRDADFKSIPSLRILSPTEAL